MRVGVAVFGYGGVCTKTTLCIGHFMRDALLENIPVGVVDTTDDPYLARSRSRALGVFMQMTDFDVMLMIDRDMTFKAKDMIDLCLTSQELDSVISVRAPKRGLGRGFAGSPVEPLVEGDTFVEATICGTGIMAIPRRTIKRAEEDAVLVHPSMCNDVHKYDMMVCPINDSQGGDFQYPDWFGPFRGWINSRWSMISCDAAFSMRLRHWGEKIYLATAYEIGHIGEMEFMAKHAQP